MLRAELKLTLQIEFQIALVERKNLAAIINCLAIGDLEFRLRIMDIKTAVLAPRSMLMGILITFEKLNW